MSTAPLFSEFSVSSPSKLILHGEHSVVFGKVAVAASLDLRTRMRLQPSLVQGRIEVEFPDVDLKQSWEADDVLRELLSKRPSDLQTSGELDSVFLGIVQKFLNVTQDDYAGRSLLCFFYLYSVICDDVVPVRITVKSDIPIGAGLGSSAALSVCLAAGLLAIKAEMRGNLEGRDDKSICNMALLSEKILHGKPSGVDNAVSTYGGVIHFSCGQVTSIKEVPNLRILLVDTLVRRNTKHMVDTVRTQAVKMEQIITPILDSMNEISLTCVKVLSEMSGREDKGEDTREQYQSLESLIDYNQKLLEAINVSHPKLEEICQVSREYGLHAKLTGAGGGGFAFVLITPFTSENLVAALKEKIAEKGFTCWETSLGVKGVQVQKL